MSCPILTLDWMLSQMFEDASAPPFYTDLYNFRDGSQDDIFEDSYPNGIPDPSPEQTVVPPPVFPSASSSSRPIATGSTSSFPQPSRRAAGRPKKSSGEVAKQLYQKMKPSRYGLLSLSTRGSWTYEVLCDRSDVDVKAHLLRARRGQPQSPGWTPDGN